MKKVCISEQVGIISLPEKIRILGQDIINVHLIGYSDHKYSQIE